MTQTRTVSDLNQITANNVVGASTTSWMFGYDNSGNMHTRVNTTLSQTTAYTWDEDNPLTSVVLPSGATVFYSYDVLGRMLTRTDASGTTQFVWSGMDCVQETDHAGVVTRYYSPGGALMSFDRTVVGVTTTYQIHRDALASIRKVTDSTGAVVATFDADAWGNALASTSDTIPNGGLQYRFVGALGVRWDGSTGLYYMRARWYDPMLQIFVSRDPRRGFGSLYAYCNNAPSSFIDKMGMAPEPTSGGGGGIEVYPGQSGPSTTTITFSHTNPSGYALSYGYWCYIWKLLNFHEQLPCGGQKTIQDWKLVLAPKGLGSAAPANKTDYIIGSIVGLHQGDTLKIKCDLLGGTGTMGDDVVGIAPRAGTTGYFTYTGITLHPSVPAFPYWKEIQNPTPQSP